MAEPRRMSEKVIALVAFGTVDPSCVQALEAFEMRVREKYRGVDTRWAYSSKTMRSRMAERGVAQPSPEMLFASLMDEGYKRAAVLCLHVVPGVEFHELRQNVQRFEGMRGGFEKIVVAMPLLSDHADMTRVADILLRKCEPKAPGEGSVFVGHGNARHASDAIYAAMNSLMMDRNPRMFVGTVSGHPAPEELIAELKNSGVRSVRLIPLMTVAGNHAKKDMAGDEPGSWKSVLAESGITSEAVFTGLVEDSEVASVWLDHLDRAFSRL
ncbi:MAG: sirohydrochlorin cobaltochelatase [Desulfobacteraceae bacterium]|nr:sirohydrochlorin cobaltochelatase [Desulfobacteraceae bacterium]